MTSQTPEIFKSDRNSYVSWAFGLMSFVFSIVLLCTLAVNDSLLLWRQGFVHKITIEVPNIKTQDTLNTKTQKNESLPKIIKVLQENPGIKNVKIANMMNMLTFLKPLGLDENVLSSLPIPTLIEIDINSKEALDLKILNARLNAIVPGSEIKTYGHWEFLLRNLNYFLQICLYFVSFIIFFTTFILIMIITRSGLLVHKNVIDILKLMGASSRFIANQLQHHAVKLAVKGSFWGTLFTIPIIIAAYLFGDFLKLPFIFKNPNRLHIFLTPIFIPLFFGVLSFLIARLNVQRLLYYNR